MTRRRTCKSCGCLLISGENNHADWCPNQPRAITSDDDTAGCPDHNRRIGERRIGQQPTTPIERRKLAERRIRKADQIRYMNQGWLQIKPATWNQGW